MWLIHLKTFGSNDGRLSGPNVVNKSILLRFKKAEAKNHQKICQFSTYFSCLEEVHPEIRKHLVIECVGPVYHFQVSLLLKGLTNIVFLINY